MVAQATDTHMSHNDSSSDFGANDWLIEEMYEQFQSDPGSVDAAWRDFFSKNASGDDAPAKQAPAEPKQGQPQQSQPQQSQPAPAPAKASQPKAEAPAAQPAGQKAAAARPAPQTEPSRSEAKASNRTVEKVEKGSETPATPGTASKLSANAPNPANRPKAASQEPSKTVMKGVARATAKAMDNSLSMPTATTVRSVPMQLVIEQRTAINNFLRRTKGGKVSFTHIIGYAMIQALKAVPAMNNAYGETDGKPTLIENPSINLGLAIDLIKPDGSRNLVVPAIKGCEQLDFAQWWAAYEEVVRKGREGKLGTEDFAGVTASLTNPGGLGTNHSVPRLMNGQGTILGVGSIDYPPEFQGTSASRVSELGVSKITTLTSTYDHRVIQGAQSGEFLRTMHQLLLGADGFYDRIFENLRIPYPPLKWDTDVSAHRYSQVSKEARVVELIQAYRTLGHLAADTDPLEYAQRSHPDLELETHGLTMWDLDREFAVGTFAGEKRAYMTLREILDTLRDSYCHTIGIEYMHITDPEQRSWFQDKFERSHTTLPREEHLRILDKLNEAEIFETFLQTKFVGQKRFSLEGGESAIVLLDEICEQAADNGLDEVCIGMPHRGRLNVLANIVGKSYGQIFREFEGNIGVGGTQGSGDVKYHLGAEGKFTAATGNTIKSSVAANPSHLEAVNPILEGITRAKQDKLGRDDYPVLPILMHGDASFAGQGVVYEVLQMSQLRGFRTGGTVHVVVNNQVGFTTSPVESRTSVYCTDVAKAVQAPVIHVNGDDPDSVVLAGRLAYEYRARFHKDVVIDLVCYRRRGHNEGDDPSFTQPNMYDLIEQKRSTRKLYTESLIGRGDISTEDAEQVMNRFRNRLEGVFKEVREETGPDDEYTRVPYYPTKPSNHAGTEVSGEVLEAVANAYLNQPEGFEVHPKVKPQLQRRAKQITEGPIDWATAELLAFASLLMEGRPVRLTGQDSRRGTFSQRFAAVVDRVTNEAYVPLKHLSDDQAPFDIYDSLLSEYATMGFEYGYSVAAPDALVLWEGQFGDFANGAQTVADEFISSGFAKWGQKSGVVLLLPHGYEGQGPDHSSARIERWLQLCSENNLAVCQPSTPANHFHLLRQHAYVNWHRPVVIMTPKSMLRNKLATSNPEDFTSGRWHHVFEDPSITDHSAVKRIVLCSGKVRWELVNKRAKMGLEGEVAIISLERLYPLPTEELVAELKRYPQVTDICFAQDEPENQGPWPFLALALPKAVAEYDSSVDLSGWRLVSRPAASAPSVGSHSVHEQQEDELTTNALQA